MIKMLEDLRDVILSCAHCKRCGLSAEGYPVCPSAERFGFEAYRPSGMASIAKGLLKREITINESVSKIVYACVMCGACVERCILSETPRGGYDNMKVLRRIREEIIENGLAPTKVKDFLENIYKYGNPWGEPREKRGQWAKDIGIKIYEPGDDFLYYVGCEASYDMRANKAAKALGEVLLATGVSFGILGKDENCDGNEVNILGEQGLFQFLVENNIQKFKEISVRKIVTLSPHSYNVLKNEYPKYGGVFEVMHYTQLIRDFIKKGVLDVSKGFEAHVTYHDSCFLGRYNEEYDAPREILLSIPKIKLVEMRRNRENSYCCGGGSGNFYMELLNGSIDSPSRIRVREACMTNAEILAVACPACLIMLDDAVKTEGLEDKITVMDISEIVKYAMHG